LSYQRITPNCRRSVGIVLAHGYHRPILLPQLQLVAFYAAFSMA